MEDGFFEFLFKPSAEAFLRSRQQIVSHAGYSPYSDDLTILNKLVADGKFQEAADYSSINTMLSPRARMLKAFAYKKLGNEKAEDAERFMYIGIIEAILSTGDGTMEKPYIVTRISDEKDLLMYLEEDMEMQALIHHEARDYDKLVTKSGKSFYFDITDVYGTIKRARNEDAEKMLEDLKRSLGANEEQKEKKPWWKFW